MSLEYIRKHYGVPAYRGARVEYTGGGPPRLGTIKGATRTGAYIRVLMDGAQRLCTMHPTWGIRYLDKAGGGEVSHG